MNPILFSIGKIKITYYGLMYAISFILGIELGKNMENRGEYLLIL